MADRDRDVMAAVLGAWTAVPSAIEQVLTEVRRLAEGQRRLEEALPSPLGSIEDACRVTGLSRSTIKRLIRDQKISVKRFGRQIRLDMRDLRPISADDIATAAAKARGK